MTTENTDIPVQLPELRLEQPEQARALAQHRALLRHFLQPQSPAEVAARLGEPANRLHHHVARLLALGLLFEQRREGGRKYVQLSARRFLVPSSLLPPGDPDENAVRTLADLQASFLAANARSWHEASAAVPLDDQTAFYDFIGEEPTAPAPADRRPQMPFGAHLDALTLRLTPERYARLCAEISDLLSAAAERPDRSGRCCTVAVLGFSRSGAEMTGVSRSVSRFWAD